MSEIKGNSKYGTDTLTLISGADKFNRWMYETIKPHCSGKILEIGSGIGNISQFFIKEGAEILLSDIEANYFPLLKEKFGNNKNLRGIKLLDLSDKNLENNNPEMIGAFDTIFALNVVEHIPDHEQAMKNALKMLKTGGKIVILVPAFQWLYNGFDKQLDHQRRYTQKSLFKLLEGNGFQVIHRQYFNLIGILGWFFSGSILHKKNIPSGQMKLYNELVPVWKLFDFFTQKIIGLSVIQVGVKP
ncbi:MAG TPA: class I SAM-dependent methyltransferase [Draconibacterium sp.]|nr:class I SAM-dependent methyltransferase [Draconibacterium sp.]